MLQQFVWYFCIVLEVLLLVQGARTSLLRKFTFFYAYITCVLLKDLISTPLYVHHPALYGQFYWIAECLLAILGYSVLMEICTLSLGNYPGAARFFRVLFFFMFLAIAMQVAVGFFSAAQPSIMRAIADLDRNLRQLQALLLICLLALFVYYKISIGRNLRGLALGYALFVGTHVIILTFVSHPTTGFAALMRTIEPLSYMVSLLIWCFALWVPRPEPAATVPCAIQRDYESFARQMRLVLIRARSHLTKAARP